MGPGPRHHPQPQPPGDTAEDDIACIQAAQRDPELFAVLYERYWEAVYLYCARRLTPVQEAEDATAVVFVKAFTALPRFTPDLQRRGSTVRSWLFSIAHNVVVDAYRRNRASLSLDAGMGTGLAETIADPASPPDALAIARDEDRRIALLLDRLPEPARTCVELRLAGLTTPEVAAVLGMSLAATKSVQLRAYRRLRDLLSAQPSILTREVPR